MRRLILVLLMLFLGLMASGQKAQYQFCVSSASFQTFKARVSFMCVDFGANAARQMVYNEVRPAIEGSLEISPYRPADCACADTCALLEVSPKDWDGNMAEGDFEAAKTVGALAEMTDMLVSESKAFFKDPSGFLMNRIFR